MCRQAAPVLAADEASEGQEVCLDLLDLSLVTTDLVCCASSYQ